MFHIRYDKDNELNGIFVFLRQEGLSNTFIVNGTTLTHDDSRGPEFVTQRNQPEHLFWASDDNSPFITFSFKYPIKLTDYTLTNAGYSGLAHSYPLEFIVEVSDNNKTWIQKDHQKDQHFCQDTQCFTPNTRHYEMKTDFIHYFKILNVKNSYFGDSYLILRSVELFGYLNLNHFFPTPHITKVSLKLFIIILLVL